MIDWKELSNEMRQALPYLNILDEEPLARHTSFRIGGPAAIFAQPAAVEALSELLKFLAARGISPRILGAGTNVLAPDEGLRGVVICTKDALTGLRDLGDGKIEAFAGETLSKTAVFARNLSLTGLEFAHGIPGTVGGGIYMNAGAYGGEMKDVVTSCRYVGGDGEIHEMSAAEMQLTYRHSVFSGSSMVITSVTMELVPGDKAEIKSRMEELMQRRRDKQPLNFPSCGSTFKRPEGYFAAALIEECGLKGFTIGGAQVSEKHSGFVINRGHATFEDVMAVVNEVKRVVLEKKGVELECEMLILQ